jgi:hypothetical protein
MIRPRPQKKTVAKPTLELKDSGPQVSKQGEEDGLLIRFGVWFCG